MKYDGFLNGTKRNYVITREVGNIPGCVPAVDVFMDHTEEEARAHVVRKADQYCNAIKAYIAGEYGGHKGEKEMWYEANKYIQPLTFIKNPAVQQKAASFLGYRTR